MAHSTTLLSLYCIYDPPLDAIPSVTTLNHTPVYHTISFNIITLIVIYPFHHMAFPMVSNTIIPLLRSSLSSLPAVSHAKTKFQAIFVRRILAVMQMHLSHSPFAHVLPVSNSPPPVSSFSITLCNLLNSSPLLTYQDSFSNNSIINSLYQLYASHHFIFWGLN